MINSNVLGRTFTPYWVGLEMRWLSNIFVGKFLAPLLKKSHLQMALNRGRTVADLQKL